MPELIVLIDYGHRAAMSSGGVFESYWLLNDLYDILIETRMVYERGVLRGNQPLVYRN